jgi:deoxyhypusine synthase
LETSLNEGYEALSDLTSKMMAERNVGSADVTKAVGDYLNEKFPKVNGLLHAAARAGVPIFIPAFSDCELGLDFHAQNLERRDAGRQEVAYSAFKDWEQYCRLIKGAKTVGILELGGGVPRNWAQQVGPFYDILTEKKLEPKSLIIRIKYAVRICSAPGTEGGLSGCGFSEGRSWGKFLAEDAGGMNAEIVGDYTLAFPLLCQAILEATVE